MNPITSFVWMCCSSLFAAGTFDSQENLDSFTSNQQTFTSEFVSEQITIDARVGASTSQSSSGSFTPPDNPHTPPSDPPAPTALTGYLPIVLVNNSGFADTDVYLSIIGTQLSGTTATSQKMYLTFDASGVGSYNNISGSGSVPVLQLSSLNTPMADHTYAVYIPESDAGSDGISGARIYFQVNSNEALVTYSGGALTEPSVLNESLASYSLFFDKFEFAYVPMGSPQVAANGTSVDFFSLPLYGYLSTPDSSSPSHSGLYEPQSYVMQTVFPHYFENRCTGPYRSAILAQWNQLYSPNATNPVRVLSPGSAMSVGTASSFPNKFDPNYLDNATDYGFSFLEYLWYGSSSYYRSNELYFEIPASGLYPQPGTCPDSGTSGVYTATINGSNQISLCPSFTTEAQSYLPAPSTANADAPSPTNGPTTFLIFGAENLNSSFAANLQGNQVSKLLEEAIIAGLLPAAFTPTVPLSNTYLSDNSSNYYSNQSRLPSNAGGPWYSVYAEAIHFLGPTYAFGFDEPLYPNVLMQCTTPTSSTYIGITIGSCDLVN